MVAGVNAPLAGSQYGQSAQWSASSLAFAAATGVFAPPQVSCFALVMPAGPQPTNAGIIVKEYAGSGGGTPSYGLVANYSVSGIVAWSIRQAGSQKGPTPTVALANYTKYAIAGTYDGAYAKLFVNGIQNGASKAVTGSPQYASGSGSSLLVGGVGDSAVTGPWNGAIYLAAMWNRGLSVLEVQALTANPWQLFEPQGRRRAYSIPASGGASLAASASDATSAAGALTTAIQMAASATDATSASGVLSTAIQLAAAASDLTSAAGQLSTQIQLAGAASDATSATAALTTAISGLSANAADTTSASGALTTAIRLGAAAADVTQATGALLTQILLAAHASDTTAAAGILSTSIQLSAAAQDLSSATGSLKTAIDLAAAALDAVSATGTLSGGNPVTGAPVRLVAREYTARILADRYASRVVAPRTPLRLTANGSRSRITLH